MRGVAVNPRELPVRAEPCHCCDLTIGCGAPRMAEIRTDDPVFANYLDGTTNDAREGVGE